MRSSIHSVQRQVAALRSALCAPGAEKIDECLPRLEEAVEGLASLKGRLTASQPSDERERARWRADLLALQSELGRAARLQRHASALWDGWALVVRSATGYTPDGEPAPLATPSHVSVKG